MSSALGIGCHIDAEGGAVGLFIGALHNVTGQDLAAYTGSRRPAARCIPPTAGLGSTDAICASASGYGAPTFSFNFSSSNMINPSLLDVFDKIWHFRKQHSTILNL